MTRRLWLETFGLSVAAVIVSASASLADTRWDGVADDDRLEVRAQSSTPATTQVASAPASSTPSTQVSNCVAIGNGQLRCYATDLAGAALDGITATSVVPGTTSPTAADVAAAVVTEFRRLPLDPSGIVVQPSRGWTLVNVDTIVLTDPATQDFDTRVLGIPVDVRATPTRYSWDFGDGSPPLVTDDPGAPWPDPTLTHTYRTTGTRRITLTTEWRGEFRTAGGAAWQPIAGVATTSADAPPLEVREAQNSLVARP